MASKLRQMGMDRAGDIYKVDPRILQDCPYGNARTVYDADKLQELADSIKEHGVQQPIVVYVEQESVFIVDGHRRTRAALLAIEQGIDIHTIPAVLQPKEQRAEVDILVRQLTANQSEQLPPMDEAHAFYRFIKRGWTQQQIATTLGYKQSYISNRIALLRADEPLQVAVENGKATPTEVVTAVRVAERDAIPQTQALTQHRAQKALRATQPRTGIDTSVTLEQDDQEKQLTHLMTVLPQDVVIGILFTVIPKVIIARVLETGELS